MRKPAMVMACCAAAVALGACGGGDEGAVEDTVQTYLSALANSDGATACDQLTGEAQREVVASMRAQLPELETTTCEDGLTMLGANIGADEEGALADVEFESVVIDGDSATATPEAGTGEAELVKVDGRWLISGGVTP